MEYHVWAVWDFMSLAKYLQNAVVPSVYPWFPSDSKRSTIAHCINSIILGEETDHGPDGLSTLSHFDLYIKAMLEIGANTEPIESFVAKRRLDYSVIPEPSRAFVKSTFATIATNKPHCVAASFAFAREDLIPSMFTRILNQIDSNRHAYPTLWYYLDRHVTLDGDEHSGMAKQLVEYFCNSPRDCYEAEQSALLGIKARHTFFDSIFDKIFWS